MTYLLDTTVLIDVLRGHEGATAFLRGLSKPAAASEATRIEILRGIRAAERTPVERLFSFLDWCPVDEPIARLAGGFAKKYRRSHPGLGTADLIIGASAEHLDLPLATSDAKHYPMLSRLRVPY